MRHESGVETREPVAVIEIREAKTMLQYQIRHATSVIACLSEHAYFLNFLGEFLGGTPPPAGFFVPEPRLCFNRRSVSGAAPYRRFKWQLLARKPA
jgi:hypothetical protein